MNHSEKNAPHNDGVDNEVEKWLLIVWQENDLFRGMHDRLIRQDLRKNYSSLFRFCITTETSCFDSREVASLSSRIHSLQRMSFDFPECLRLGIASIQRSNEALGNFFLHLMHGAHRCQQVSQQALSFRLVADFWNSVKVTVSDADSLHSLHVQVLALFIQSTQ